MGWLHRRVFGIDPGETSAARRGFRGEGNEPARRRLERIGRLFLVGYHASLEDDRPGPLLDRLKRVEREDQGFAFEGAAMGLSLLDQLAPWRGARLPAFLEGPGAAHVYMVHVGAGWAAAQLRRRVDRLLLRFDPLLRWLVVDGYGFHHGYFQPRRCIDAQWAPAHLSEYARRAFDQGLGRSLWFVEGAGADRIAATIARFPAERRADLWSGVGLACAYAGGATTESIRGLRAAAGEHQPCLGQGAAFAAKARQRAGNNARHTDMASRILCEMPSEDAARLTDDALVDLPKDGEVPAYEAWRRRIQAACSEEVVKQ